MDSGKSRTRIPHLPGLGPVNSPGPGFSALPAGFLDYLKWLEDTVETRVGLISTGVDREDIIFRRDEFKKILGEKARVLG